MNSGLVVLMGLGVVFFGLICIIVVCKCMSFVVGKIEKAPATANAPESKVATQNSAKAEAIPSRPELAAAVVAAIAEYTGKDISGIRIHSIKKL